MSGDTPSDHLQPPATLNEVEEATEHLQKLRQWLKQDAQPALPPVDVDGLHTQMNIDSEYYDALEASKLRLKKFLLDGQEEQVNRKNDMLMAEAVDEGESVGSKLNGLAFANDRMPYTMERGDLIGVALANVKLEQQVRWSQEVIKDLEVKIGDVEKRISGQEDRRLQLQVLVEGLRRRVEGEQGGASGGNGDLLAQMRDRVETEKIRSRKLRTFAKELEKRQHRG